MQTFLEFKTVTAEPAPNGPVLFNEIPSCFSEATEQDLAAGACAGERTLAFSCTRNLTPSPALPTKPKDHAITRTYTPEPFQKPRVPCPGRLGADALSLYMATFKGLHLKPAPPALPHTCVPSPSKTLGLVQRARCIGGSPRFPIFSVGTFSVNKPFLTPNPDMWSFDLLMPRAHRLGFSAKTPVASLF